MGNVVPMDSKLPSNCLYMSPPPPLQRIRNEGGNDLCNYKGLRLIGNSSVSLHNHTTTLYMQNFIQMKSRSSELDVALNEQN